MVPGRDYSHALLQSLSNAPQLLWQVIAASPSADAWLPPVLQATLQFEKFASHWLTHAFPFCVAVGGEDAGADAQAAATAQATASNHA
jgi:hypothetical protein